MEIPLPTALSEAVKTPGSAALIALSTC
jgi:hypothetical protein